MHTPTHTRLSFLPPQQRLGVNPQLASRQLSPLQRPAPPGPGGLVGMLSSPGVGEGMLAAGLRLLASDRKRETFGQALYDAVPQGVAAYEDARGNAEYKTMLDQSGMDERTRALLALLPRAQGTALLAQAAMQPKPDLINVPTGTRVYDPVTKKMVFENPAPQDNQPDRQPLLGVALELLGLRADQDIPPNRLKEVEDKYLELVDAQQGPGVTVNTEAMETVREKRYANMYMSLTDKADAARESVDTLRTAAELVAGGAYQGPGSQARLGIARVANAFGVPVEGLSETEQLQAIGNELALDKRELMNGTMSDGDRDFLTKTTVNLKNSPEGNMLIIQAAARLAQRDIEVARLADEYIDEYGTLDSGFTELLVDRFANESMFADLEQQAQRLLGETATSQRDPAGIRGGG